MFKKEDFEKSVIAMIKEKYNYTDNTKTEGDTFINELIRVSASVAMDVIWEYHKQINEKN